MSRFICWCDWPRYFSWGTLSRSLGFGPRIFLASSSRFRIISSRSSICLFISCSFWYSSGLNNFLYVSSAGFRLSSDVGLECLAYCYALRNDSFFLLEGNGGYLCEFKRNEFAWIFKGTGEIWWIPVSVYWLWATLFPFYLLLSEGFSLLRRAFEA